MLDICTTSTKEFKETLHHLLEIVVNHFIEIGSHLSYEEIYSVAFPLHIQKEEVYIKKFLENLQREIVDDFKHSFTPMKEYVLFHVLSFVYEASEDGFLLEDEVANKLKKINKEKLEKDELIVLNSITNPQDIIGICFDDLDFLDVHLYFEIYKNHPEVISNFFNVDLDIYTELMPRDILLEYNSIKEVSETHNVASDTELYEKSFYNYINDLIDSFAHAIVHKKGHTLINNKLGEYTEKHVQALFYMYAENYLKNSNLVIKPEIDTGRGAVDFYISSTKNSQALIEFKLGSHNRFPDGLKYQLPTYLLAEKIKYGFFVLICYSEDIFNKSEYLFKEANMLSNEFGKSIYFKRINASGNLESGSKIRNKNEMGFNE